MKAMEGQAFHINNAQLMFVLPHSTCVSSPSGPWASLDTAFVNRAVCVLFLIHGKYSN